MTGNYNEIIKNLSPTTTHKQYPGRLKSLLKNVTATRMKIQVCGAGKSGKSGTAGLESAHMLNGRVADY